MKSKTIETKSINLWEKVIKQTNHALNCGALQSIPTECEVVEDHNLKFLVRIVANLARKEEAKNQENQQSKKMGKKSNPFLPYEQDLFVANLSETHLCLLNKYNVVDYHLLIVTRVFEEQETWLNLNDFAALGLGLSEIDGLGFYNSGVRSGASQRHKHLQLVPLPLSADDQKTPIEPLINKADFQGEIGQISAFNFSHAITKIQLNPEQNNLQNALIMLENYHKLLEAIDLPLNQEKPNQDYNLLITRQWMMIVERSQANYESIPVNSLGFAGALLVKNDEQLKRLKQLSPLTVLENVAQS